jgi:hypothetical protein
MFSFLTQPNYPKAAIGLEKEAVTALALERSGGQFNIRSAATIELPPNLITPSFSEKNIASADEFRVLLEEAATSAGLLKETRWSVSLPSNSARAAILTLETEPASRSEAEEVLEWKSEQSFGVPAGEMRITRVKISPDAEKRTRYFATAVKLSVVDEYETVFESLGWKAGLILPRALGEARWLTNRESPEDSLLISSQGEGFTALLFRGDEPAVVRTVACTAAEREDEIFRLLMFYHDRVAGEQAGLLQKLLLVGKDINAKTVRDISAEALGHTVNVLTPDQIGLNIPVGSLAFDDIAAPAGLASMAWN